MQQLNPFSRQPLLFPGHCRLIVFSLWIKTIGSLPMATSASETFVLSTEQLCLASLQRTSFYLRPIRIMETWTCRNISKETLFALGETLLPGCFLFLVEIPRYPELSLHVWFILDFTLLSVKPLWFHALFLDWCQQMKQISYIPKCYTWLLTLPIFWD